ncbi:DUF4336 domain-containing protein [Parvibaculaceae bacterium PLY_AMNH_Bact1]|nr:DUF4336 domain-containing protein [Parvibaculaceae bacterium PLY_AMNH_Bact1]
MSQKRMLQKIGNEIWMADGDCVSFYGFPYPTRCLVVRLQKGGLWIWSPIKPTPELLSEVRALGAVQHLVSPNKLHYLFMGAWAGVFPDAKLWGPSSTIAKCPDLEFETALAETPPTDWADEIDQVWMQGSPALDEIVFHHKSSGTTILADLSENFSAAFLAEHWKPWARWIARRWKIVEGWGYAPLEWRLSFIFRKPARAAKTRILDWPTEQVVMAHGEWQPSDGQAFLKRAFAWL